MARKNSRVESIVKKDPNSGKEQIIVIKTLDEALALFDLDQYLVPFLADEPFFCEISRYIFKRPSLQVPTAGIGYNQKDEEFQLFWNPLFFYTLTPQQVNGVLKHEFMHFICRHLTERRRDPARAHNIASDAAINSLIIKDDNNTRANATDLPLPGFCIIPGRRPDPIPEKVLKRMSKEEIEYNLKVASLIEGWPALETTEYYFEEMMRFNQANPMPERKPCPIHGPGGKGRMKGRSDEGDEKGEGSGGKHGDEKCDKHGDGDCDCGHGEGDGDEECTCGGYDSMDDHSGWDELPEEVSEYVRAKAQQITEKAVQAADQKQNGWGSVPAHMREKIRKSVSNIVNWREIMKHFVGQLMRGKRSTSIKKLNKRYPYIHPGVKRGYVAKLLVAIDESGSVPNGCVELFFAELASLTRQIEIDVVSFDAACDPAEIVTWKRGQGMPAYRTRCGGTNFDAPTDVANDPRFRGRWDGLLVLTDGFAPKPGPSRIQRGWGIAPGCKPEFETDELMFFIEKDSTIKKGGWY